MIYRYLSEYFKNDLNLPPFINGYQGRAGRNARKDERRRQALSAIRKRKSK